VAYCFYLFPLGANKNGGKKKWVNNFLKKLVFKGFGQMSERHFQMILIINLVNVLFSQKIKVDG
jgi:hypothetical protein